jgi:beta-glucosidase
MTSFPLDFLWGVATAGHQSEGDNIHSDMWFLERTSPTLFREQSGKGCRSYDLFEVDLDAAQDMGLTAFRFSVEWARIEPTRGDVSETELDHYERIVDAVLSRGMAPIVTYNHFASPHWFSAAGSWVANDAAALFAAHADRVTARIGDRIAAAVTLNEPNLEQLLHAAGKLPPEAEEVKKAMLAAAARTAGTERYFASNVIPASMEEDFQDAFTIAHREAKAAIKARRGDLPVGVSIAIADDQATPGGEAHRDARRAAVYDHWLRVSRDDDFIGVQNYESVLHGAEGEIDRVGPKNGMGSLVDPASLAGAVRYAHAVSGVPVLVTEHGIQTEDDASRARFIVESLEGLGHEIAAGTPVIGYCHWTLLDNFEWIFGFGPKLGLIEVDRHTFVRTPKPSASVYGTVVRTAQTRTAVNA